MCVLNCWYRELSVFIKTHRTQIIIKNHFKEMMKWIKAEKKKSKMNDDNVSSMMFQKKKILFSSVFLPNFDANFLIRMQSLGAFLSSNIRFGFPSRWVSSFFLSSPISLLHFIRSQVDDTCISPEQQSNEERENVLYLFAYYSEFIHLWSYALQLPKSKHSSFLFFPPKISFFFSLPSFGPFFLNHRFHRIFVAATSSYFLLSLFDFVNILEECL